MWVGVVPADHPQPELLGPRAGRHQVVGVDLHLANHVLQFLKYLDNLGSLLLTLSFCLVVRRMGVRERMVSTSPSTLPMYRPIT